MSNSNPNQKYLCKQKAKWTDATGNTVETKTARFPAYLLPRLQAIAWELHQEEIAKQAANEKTP